MVSFQLFYCNHTVVEQTKFFHSFHSIVLATKVSIERKNQLTADEITKLQGFYRQMIGPAVEIYRKDVAERGKSSRAFEEELVMHDGFDF